MFIWNNIFFSLGFDVRDHYKDFGGDYAAYAAPVSDISLVCWTYGGRCHCFISHEYLTK